MTTTSKAHLMTKPSETDIYEYLINLIKRATKAYLAREQITFDFEELPIDLRFSAQSSFGDYSMPVMPWASKNKLGRPPMSIAEQLAGVLRELHDSAIDDITVTKPGFLNFFLNRPSVGKAIIEHVMEAGADFGHNDTGIGTKVIVEHTAINSNKAAHVGHLRNACLGDTMARILRSQGYNVEAENYIDDSGAQVADVVVGFILLQEGILQLPEGNQQLPGESFDYYCSRVYVAVGKAYEVQPELLELRKTILHAIEHGNEPETGPDYPVIAADLSRKIVQTHLETMARLNISYDLLTWESAILDAGLWKRVFEMLRERGLIEKPETGLLAGCWVLPFGEGEVQTEEGDHTSNKVLVRKDGTATYTAKDIAYQLWKFGLADETGVQFHFVPWGRQRDGRLLWSMLPPNIKVLEKDEPDPKRFGHARRVINVIDVRQSYPQQIVYESLRRLGFTEQADNSMHLAYEVVTLSAATAVRLGVDTSDAQKFYTMSGRKGIEIKADDLINAAVTRMQEVETKRELSYDTAAILAASAIRYFMIRFNLQQIIALDIDEALRGNGDTGVYLQYAYARANSILRRLQENNYEEPDQLAILPDKLDQSEWKLLLHIDAFPRKLAEASGQLAPNMLAAYTYDLAAHFSDFYEHTPPILKETDAQVKAFRAMLVRATVQTMDNALRILGFVPLERI